MRSFLLLASILFSTIVNAQDWVITTSLDTLSGEILIQLPSTTFEDIVLKNDEGKQRLKAYQFIGFNKDGVFYKTIKHEGKFKIMKVEKEGYLSLYAYRENEGFQFSTKYLLKMDGEGLIVPSITFKTKIKNYLIDCNKIADGLENKKYSKSDLTELIDDYNKCIDENTKRSTIEIAEIKNLDSPLLDLVESIREKTPEDAELNSLLNDIKNKLIQDKPVPAYMKSALKEYTTNMENVSKEVEELLQSL